MSAGTIQTPQATKPLTRPGRRSSPADHSPAAAPRCAEPVKSLQQQDHFPAGAMTRTNPSDLSPRPDQAPSLTRNDSESIMRTSGWDPSPAAAIESPSSMSPTPQQGTTPTATANGSSASVQQDQQPTRRALSLSDPFLALAAAMVDDLEKVRMANANRLRILTTPVDQADEDGICRGFGLSEDHRDVARLAGMVTALKAAEDDAVKTLQHVVRRHPLGPWAKGIKGVGDKQFARLLASIGDPYWNDLHDRPRTVSELWAFSGLHAVPGGQRIAEAHGGHAAGAHNSSADQGVSDGQASLVGGGKAGSSDPGQCADGPPMSTAWVAARRRKGTRANWSTIAKTRAWLIGQQCMKTVDQACKTDVGFIHVENCGCSPYRLVYDARRARTAVTHPEWTPMHSQNDAIRIAAKEFMKDLWRESRCLHLEAATS